MKSGAKHLLARVTVAMRQTSASAVVVVASTGAAAVIGAQFLGIAQ